MKGRALVLLVGVLSAPAVLAFGCGPVASPPRAATVVANRTATLKIEGMTCASCAVTVRTAASKLDGLAAVEVDAATGRATVTFDGSKVTAEEIAAKITDAGYRATVLSDSEV